MSNFGEIVTTIAVMAFLLAIYMVEANPVLSFIIMFFAGAWVVSYTWWQEEERIARAKERER